MNLTVLKACLLGGALGDSVGLPSEGMNARRIARLRPGALRQSLVFGKGMVSGDTEHAVMTLLKQITLSQLAGLSPAELMFPDHCPHSRIQKTPTPILAHCTMQLLKALTP